MALDYPPSPELQSILDQADADVLPGGQGVQQSGAAVLLSFDVPPSGARRVASSMLAPWMPASWEAGELRSTHAAVKVEDHSRRARWTASAGRSGRR